MLDLGYLFEWWKAGRLRDETTGLCGLAEAFLVEVRIRVRVGSWARHCVLFELILFFFLTFLALVVDYHGLLLLQLLALLRGCHILPVAGTRLLLISLKRLLDGPMLYAVQSLFLVGVGSVECEAPFSGCFGLLPLLAEVSEQALHLFEVGRLLAKWVNDPREKMVGILCF